MRWRPTAASVVFADDDRLLCAVVPGVPGPAAAGRVPRRRQRPGVGLGAVRGLRNRRRGRAAADHRMVRGALGNRAQPRGGYGDPVCSVPATTGRARARTVRRRGRRGRAAVVHGSARGGHRRGVPLRNGHRRLAGGRETWSPPTTASTTRSSVSASWPAISRPALSWAPPALLARTGRSGRDSALSAHCRPSRYTDSTDHNPSNKPRATAVTHTPPPRPTFSARAPHSRTWQPLTNRPSASIKRIADRRGPCGAEPNPATRMVTAVFDRCDRVMESGSSK
ncbi:Uncharacterised protein [Nocardia asteroides]|nr:hypothetical protein SAMN05444423_11511 [Nocardia asteroides]VEG36425.1 Uncharacterised protein [Nocardia asteroides]